MCGVPGDPDREVEQTVTRSSVRTPPLARTHPRVREHCARGVRGARGTERAAGTPGGVVLELGSRLDASRARADKDGSGEHTAS